MNQNNIVSIVYASPIERIRAGKVVLSVTCQFDNGKTTCGFALADDDTLEKLTQAQEEAIQRAIDLANSISQPTENLLVQVVKDLAVPVMENQQKVRLSESKITEAQFNLLYNPVDQNKQKELFNLCDALGITRIDAVALGWNMLDTVATIAALAKLAKRLEAK
jgi:hypothetical protein